ncbi:MAG TPA: hypothetical protein VFM37_16345 [Pseudonocardiaceae bacterium]|nr:hypothetical protein [Pseudonocardiaceae bacterium]
MVFPLVALAEGKDGAALGPIRTGPGAAPAGSVRPAELARKILGYRELRPAKAVRLPPPATRTGRSSCGSPAA